MSRIERGLKLRWHRELASSPQTHAWALNLYRAGEKHPQTVDDYFPHAHAEEPWLIEALRRHEADEARHTWLYTQAIRELGQPVEELNGTDVFNQVIRQHTDARFDIRDGMSRDEKRFRIGHFLAHAHFLEVRISQSLEWHVEACEQMGARAIGAVVAEVLADEERHVSYTRSAAMELLGSKAKEVLAIHQAGERRANFDFSQHAVRGFLARFGRRSPTHLWFGWSAQVMRAGVALV